MFYPSTSLSLNCCNPNVEIVNNSSYHVSWYAPSYLVPQTCQGLGIVVIGPFLKVPPEEVATWVQIRGVGWPREVGATRSESITRKIPAKVFQRSVWTVGWCSILLVDSCAHIYSPFTPQCRNELRPHECNVTVCVQSHLILIIVLKKKWPDDASSSDGTPRTHFLLAKRAMGMFMGLGLSPESHILLVDAPTQVLASFATKENQMQQARVNFSIMADIFTKCFSFCFIMISLPLQDLNFVSKELKVMEVPQNWCFQNASFLWETAWWFSGGFLKAFPQILNILRNYGWTMSTTSAFVGMCHISCLPKFGHQSWIVLLSATLFLPKSLLHCHCVNWFCGKLCLDDFHPLLRSIASSWTHIGVKRIFQVCCQDHLKNMEKKL